MVDFSDAISIYSINKKLQGRQGIIKKIYKGILFLYDETEQENNGYMCIKAQLCEKVNVSGNDPSEKVCIYAVGDAGFFIFVL